MVTTLKTNALPINIIFIFISIIIFTSPSLQQQPQSSQRLVRAYTALQAWKHVITSDPNGVTSNWYGFDVCNYTGVFCAPAPDDPHVTTVAGIDLNHANIAGALVEDLGLLSDLTLFHINSNRFCGSIPFGFSKLGLLHELDVSNNLLAGKFPAAVLRLPSLKFLAIRFNSFQGDIPSALFDMKLDALFINNNKFRSLPENLGNSPVSVVVFANNNLNGCFPASLGKMAGTLQEVILMNSGLTGCLPPEIGLLKLVTVFDVSGNRLAGPIPAAVGGMRSLEQLNVARNQLSGKIPDIICSLPRLENFTYSDNYLCAEPETCLRLPEKDDRRNCVPYRPLQRSKEECSAFYAHPVDCAAYGCRQRTPPAASPPPVHHHYP